MCDAQLGAVAEKIKTYVLPYPPPAPHTKFGLSARPRYLSVEESIDEEGRNHL
jgi:hypothetical protein